jgi:two-component system LytT family response regulator
MKRINYVIVDDNADARDVIRSQMVRYKDDFRNVGEASCGKDAIDLIQEVKPELVFLDIDLGDFSAFQILEAFKNPPFYVIIVTGHENRAMEAMKYCTVAYLLKPLAREDLEQGIHTVQKLVCGVFDGNTKHLRKTLDNNIFDRVIIPLSRSYEIIPLKDVMYLEAMRGNYTVFWMLNNEQHLATKPLNYYDKLLDNTHFYRIHKSHLVNIDEIRQVDGGTSGEVHLSTGKPLAIAYRRKKELLNQLRRRTTPVDIL